MEAHGRVIPGEEVQAELGLSWVGLKELTAVERERWTQALSAAQAASAASLITVQAELCSTVIEAWDMKAKTGLPEPVAGYNWIQFCGRARAFTRWVGTTALDEPVAA